MRLQEDQKTKVDYFKLWRLKKSLFQPNLDELVIYKCTTIEMDQRLFL